VRLTNGPAKETRPTIPHASWHHNGGRPSSLENDGSPTHGARDLQGLICHYFTVAPCSRGQFQSNLFPTSTSSCAMKLMYLVHKVTVVPYGLRTRHCAVTRPSGVPPALSASESEQCIHYIYKGISLSPLTFFSSSKRIVSMKACQHESM
jgi:hypothetical protein